MIEWEDWVGYRTFDKKTYLLKKKDGTIHECWLNDEKMTCVHTNKVFYSFDDVQVYLCPDLNPGIKCPECGTTELLCGYNGDDGCTSESNNEDG